MDRITLLGAVFLTAISIGCQQTTATASPDRHATAAKSAVGERYYLSRCAACEQLLGTRGAAIPAVIDRRDLQFCCRECLETFNRDPNRSLAALDHVLVSDQAPFYPTDRSIVSGRPLGESQVNLIWGNRLVRVADAREGMAFESNPQQYLDELDRRVIQLQTPYYLVRKCPVQGTMIEDAVDEELVVVVGGRMIRLCCTDCRQRVLDNPRQFLPLIDFALREQMSHHGASKQR